ncbi:MAG: M23 family metallopeptidase [Chloroflexota bacterium]|nr:M23 family metallopeptidase [Chloroflexota bacterium]
MTAGRITMPFGGLVRAAGDTIERLSWTSPRQLGRRALFIAVNLIVAAIVMALPFMASAAAQPTQASQFSAPTGSTSLAPVDGGPLLARAATQARGGTISAARNPLTVPAQAVPSTSEYTLSASDTLWTIANYYGLSAETIAFANGITDPYHLQNGKRIVIPPSQGALYTVANGDTVASVAARFKVDPSVIQTYNRLYFEESNFAPGQSIFVPDATLPSLPPPAEATTTVQSASVIARPSFTAPAAGAPGFLPWPVSGYISQYMSAVHTGVDIAAPYGSGLASGINGVISENGWVAVGGLHICVKSATLDECFFHMSAALYPVGTEVTVGQVIGAIGLTGVTTGPHVHWETRIAGRFVNPLTVQP